MLVLTLVVQFQIKRTKPDFDVLLGELFFFSFFPFFKYFMPTLVLYWTMRLCRVLDLLSLPVNSVCLEKKYQLAVMK